VTPSSNEFLSYRRKRKNRPSYMIGFLGRIFMRNVRRLFSFISNFMVSVLFILCMLLVQFCDVHGISNMKLNA
jgi:hypothetical protein